MARSAHPIEIITIAILLSIALVAAWKGLLDAKRYPNVPVAAESYVLPRGCKPADLLPAATVPERCAASRYRLRNATELGLITTGRQTRWYRVGDDAVLLYCFKFASDNCDVRNRVFGKFVRSFR